MRIKFLSKPFSPKHAFASAVNVAWYRWRLWQHNNSRWILFWTLREIREHYRLWRMRPAILKQRKTLMSETAPGLYQQTHDYTCGARGVEMVKGRDMPSKAPIETYWTKDMWKKYSEGLGLAHLTAEENMDRLMKENEVLHNQDSEGQ